MLVRPASSALPASRWPIGKTLRALGDRPRRRVRRAGVRGARPASALIDELGELTYAEIDERSNRLADALRDRGVGAGDGVAILCRNHRGFVDASSRPPSSARTSSTSTPPSPAPSSPRCCEREEPGVVVHDEEFTDLLDEAGRPCTG